MASFAIYRNIVTSWLHILYSGAVTTSMQNATRAGIGGGTNDVYSNLSRNMNAKSRVVPGYVGEMRLV
jgi:hypothetical protein